MGKINKNDRTQNKLDQQFSDKLRDFEANPPEFIWSNIEENLDSEKEKSKFDHWYYVILALLIPITVANLFINYNFEQITDEFYGRANRKIVAVLSGNYNKTKNNSSNSNNSTNNKTADYNTTSGISNNTPVNYTTHNYNSNNLLAVAKNNKNNSSTISNKKSNGLTNVSNENPINIQEQQINNATIKTGISFNNTELAEANILKLHNYTASNIIQQKISGIRGFYLGADVKMNNSRFLIKQSATNNFIGKDIEYQFKYGYSYGISFGYNFNEKMGIETEINYTQQGQSYIDNTSRKIPIAGNIDLTYLKVPVMFKYKWVKVSGITQQPVAFNLLFGPMYNRLIQSEYKVTNEQFAQKAIIPENELGLVLGFEYDLFMSRNTFLTLGLRTGVSSDVKSFPYAGPNVLKTLNLDLGIGAAVNFQFAPKQKTLTQF